MPFFEESIYLIELEMEKKSRKEIALDIRKELKKEIDLSYQNEFGEEISWQIIKIIDVFDPIYDIKEIVLPNEVYCRHFSGKSLDNIIETFYSDFVWEDES